MWINNLKLDSNPHQIFKIFLANIQKRRDMHIINCIIITNIKNKKKEGMENEIFN